MSQTGVVSGNQLSNALHALGVNFILRGKQEEGILHKHPQRLIAALAGSEEARLRLSLIPLFLEHPEFSEHVRSAAEALNPPDRLTLRCYYSAAVWLAQEYRLQGISLPDYFSLELGIQAGDDPEINLRRLAQRHQELSGTQVNWLGTYHHAGKIWRRGLELQHGQH